MKKDKKQALIIDQHTTYSPPLIRQLEIIRIIDLCNRSYVL